MVAIGMVFIWPLERLSNTECKNQLIASVGQRMNGFCEQTMGPRVKPGQGFEEKVSTVSNEKG